MWRAWRGVQESSEFSQRSEVRFKGDHGELFGVSRTTFYLVFETKILVKFQEGGGLLSFQIKGSPEKILSDGEQNRGEDKMQ